jgi:hypothetical protein
LYGAGTGGLTADKFFIVVSPVNYGVRLQNQLESLLEEAHIKLSSLVSDLLGVSAQRMLKALSEGETNPAALAALADHIAEVGPAAATFPSEKCLSSWVGACPGDDESAGVNYSHRSPKGNRHMRRVLNQCANAAVKAKGTIFDIVYRRSVPRLGHNQVIGAIANRQCRLIWLILHQGVRYEERGPAVTKQSKQRRTARMIRQLRILGYRIEPPNPKHSDPAQG